MNHAETVNGHGEIVSPVARPKTFVIRNLRLDPGQTIFVRLLTSKYGGLFTHYLKNRSTVCQGKDCRHQRHGIDRVWKGYAPVQVHNPAENIWMPWCLEITEYLELDMRDVFDRGQVWELYRLSAVGKDNPPLQGKLHPDQVDPNLPQPFDIIPCLRALYHTDVIDLSHKSPLAPRVYVQASAGPAPEILKPKVEQGTPDDFSFADEFRKMQRKAAEGKTSPTEKKRR